MSGLKPIWLALVTGLAALSAAQEYKGVTFVAPKGWTETQQGDAKVFMPKDLRAGEMFAIFISPAVPTGQGEPKAQFESIVKKAHAEAVVLTSTDVETKAGEGFVAVMQTVTLGQKDGSLQQRIYVLIIAGKQLALSAIVMNNQTLLDRYGGLAMDFIASINFKKDPIPPQKPAETTSTGEKVPIGETPKAVPGAADWLPSGKGVPIPEPGLVDDVPVGLWWSSQNAAGAPAKAAVRIYMGGRVVATNPRLGGPYLYDHEGQKAQTGKSGVGTFTVGAGTITERIDGAETKGAFAAGSDKDGEFFKIDAATYRPLFASNLKLIVGHWKSGSSEIKLFADGAFEVGTTSAAGVWTPNPKASGTFGLEGYLLFLRPKEGPGRVEVVGMAGKRLVRGSEFFTRNE